MSSIGNPVAAVGGSSLMVFHNGGILPSSRYYTMLTDAANVNVDAGMAVSTIRLHPFIGGGKVDEIAIRQNAAGGAGGIVRLGIYQATSRTSLYPSALLASGDVAVDGANGAKKALIDVTLEDGVLYWLAAWGNAASVGFRTHHSVPATQFGIWGMDSDLLQSQPHSTLQLALAFAAYPDPFPAGATLNRNVNIPLVFLHYA